jgi:hypothetical protein
MVDDQTMKIKDDLTGRAGDIGCGNVRPDDFEDKALDVLVGDPLDVTISDLSNV